MNPRFCCTSPWNCCKQCHQWTPIYSIQWLLISAFLSQIVHSIWYGWSHALRNSAFPQFLRLLIWLPPTSLNSPTQCPSRTHILPRPQITQWTRVPVLALFSSPSTTYHSLNPSTLQYNWLQLQITDITHLIAHCWLPVPSQGRQRRTASQPLRLEDCWGIFKYIPFWCTFKTVSSIRLVSVCRGYLD